MNKYRLTGYILAFGLSCVAVSPAYGESFERELLRHTPEVMRYLRQQNCRNVGVLKFHIQKGQERATTRAGTLNLTAAQRLELALIVTNDVQQPIGVLRDASLIAAGIPGATHLTPEGRQKLLAAQYPVAWGTEQVRPDVLLTGLIRMNANLQQMTVHLRAFGKADPSLKEVTKFTVDVGVADLLEAGESFLLRGAFGGRRQFEQRPDAEKEAEKMAGQVAAHVRAGAEKYPLADARAPIELEIRYDDRRVLPEYRAGIAVLPEPLEGQTVSFVLRRRDPGPECYGIVLKVNGENTLFRQRLKDVQCRKWILGPEDPPTVIRGFQTSAGAADKFRILSLAESKQQELDYGADVGLITMTVFREGRGAPEAPPLTREEQDLAVLTRGVFPEHPPVSLKELKRQLRANEARAAIGRGVAIDSGTEQVPFRPDPVPVMSATIRYYRP